MLSCLVLVDDKRWHLWMATVLCFHITVRLYDIYIYISQISGLVVEAGTKPNTTYSYLARWTAGGVFPRLLGWVLHQFVLATLQWHHNGHDSVSNHQPHDCLLSRLFRHRSKKTSKLHVTGLCAGNSPGTGEFPVQMASYAENVSIWWCHHASDAYLPSKIDLENGLLFDRCQAIIWSSDGILIVGALEADFNEILMETQ